MIVTHSCNQPTIRLPNSALCGVQVVSEIDCRGFTVYEARIGALQTVSLQSPDDQACVHFYYFISGTGKCEGKGGKDDHYKVGPDQVVALSSDVTRTLATEVAMRVLVVYYPDADCAFKSLELLRSLPELVGSERDISCETMNSRRFITRQDGFPLGIHNTWLGSMTSSRLEYKNHIESVYFLTGKVTYHWQDGNGQWKSENSKVDESHGTNFLMNIHDKHIVESHDEEVICICIFDPVLTGKESHHLSEDGFSSYDALP